MKIINDNTYGDYHIHSSTLSDGLNSIDEMVIQAGRLNYKEIAITDHNQEYLNTYNFKANTHYSIISSRRWKNIHNDVQVIFGVEADLLNENGDICDHIQNITPEFIILSAHQKMYSGDRRSIKNGYLNAINRYGSKIKILGHLCSQQFSDYLNEKDIIEIVSAAGRAGISLELNCANLVNDKTCMAHLKTLLSCCKSLYVNSDAHTLYEFINVRDKGFNYLKLNNFI
ncbi:MAG: PHP domain-containing protein [Proteobacteria bacterium]|nr:PHP domain-containing protein [Pseudomonadota bacterium]MBU1581364.1 PHP domain-containing protein [Pseudomonadota bacterium]MBU2451707.1 PHP domain-containing protein [Pseudomonadota bacterium]MBU2627728.1 PHP domain-containing protein [Pseudomonadota bacterium]